MVNDDHMLVLSLLAIPGLALVAKLLGDCDDILGNASNPIGLAFENVTVDAPGAFPFGKGFECEHASGTAAASSPVPPCLTPR